VTEGTANGADHDVAKTETTRILFVPEATAKDALVHDVLLGLPEPSLYVEPFLVIAI
jgi:hypothetical protein